MTDKQKEIENKPIIFPSYHALDQMSIAELTLVKQNAERLEAYIARKIRRKIQN